MLGWLRKKIVDTAISNNGKALQRFIDSVAGMSKDEIGHLLAVATMQRLVFDENGLIKLTAYLDGELVEDDDGLYAIKIGSFIKDLQKKNNAAPAGAMMIWLHSARAVTSPPLRILGKHLWVELSRGQQDIDDLRAATFGLTSLGLSSWPDSYSSEACLYVPRLLGVA